MANITLVLGYSCSGKEVYMRHIHAGQGLRLSAEEFQRKVPPFDLIALLDSLIDGRAVIIEGFPLDHIADVQDGHGVSAYIVTYAPLFILAQRRRWGRPEPSSKDFYQELLKGVEGFYRKLLKAIDLSKTEFFNSFENTHHRWTETEFWTEWERINRLPTKRDEEIFLEEVSKEQGDHYTPIVLPHHTYEGGIKTTDPQATWDKIKELGVDVKGKRVVDVGCYEGHTVHLALQDGAANALGLDAHEAHLRRAVKIAWLKQSPVNFLYFNINYNMPWFANDMILCLNMLHYTSPHIALPKMFKATREAVFEINNEHVPIVKQYAKQHGFSLMGTTTCRIARTILWFQK